MNFRTVTNELILRKFCTSISKKRMDAYDVVITKLDVKEFDSKPVPRDVNSKILEAARLTGSGINSQHWRFILVQDPNNLRQLADDSTTGKWVQGAEFRRCGID